MARVLVVDDDVAIRRLICVFLDADTGFDVVGEAGSCAEALAQAEALMPDLVTMDHAMPGDDGATCIREMKKRWPGLHILAVTGSGDEVGNHMIAAGAYAKIDKAHMQSLLPALYQVADRRARPAGQSAAEESSALERIRDAIAALETEAATSLAAEKKRLEERLELVVALRAIHVAASNSSYTPERALDAIKEFTGAILETPAAKPTET